MKTIVVKVYFVDPKDSYGRDLEMRVIASSHPRFTTGSRWDWGFQHISLKEGYTTVLIPTDEVLLCH